MSSFRSDIRVWQTSSETQRPMHFLSSDVSYLQTFLTASKACTSSIQTPRLRSTLEMARSSRKKPSKSTNNPNTPFRWKWQHVWPKTIARLKHCINIRYKSTQITSASWSKSTKSWTPTSSSIRKFCRNLGSSTRAKHRQVCCTNMWIICTTSWSK